MKSLLSKGLVFAVVLVAATVANAATLTWPSEGQTWDTQPLAPYASGAVSIGTLGDGNSVMNMPAPTSAGKTSWLPYGGTYSEKMAIARLQLAPGETVTGVHAKVYDPATTGKSGWALILQDADGKLLDLGVRAHSAVGQVGQIVPRQWDGTAWSNGNASSRGRTGNNYYTMDLSQNADGTVNYSIAGWENGSEWNWAATTTVAYGDLTGVYLSTSTPDTSGAAAYKWTEFTSVPEPATLILIGFGGLLSRRRIV